VLSAGLDPIAIPYRIRSLSSQFLYGRSVALRALEKFSTPEAIDALIRLQGQQSGSFVRQAILLQTAQQVKDGDLPPGTYGNAGRFNLKGPGVFQLDMALSRTFAIREGKTLQLRVEAFNLPNHLNPSTPVATLNSGSFGQIQSDISGTSGLTAGDSRVLQFASKWIF
jgi:hypothetical protein